MSTRPLKRAPDPWRQRLLDAIVKAGDTLQGVSLKVLDRNEAYLHQYLYRATPRVLGEKDRKTLARRYRIPQEDLMPPGWINDMLTYAAETGLAPQEDTESREGRMSPTRKAITRIMRLPMPYEERIAMVNDILASCPEADEGLNPPNGRTTS